MIVLESKRMVLDMKNKYLVLLLVVTLVALLPYAALAIDSLEIDGSSFTAADLAGNLSGAGWAWLTAANGGQGELRLSGYNGGAIAATDGVLHMHLTGENIMTADAAAVLSVKGENTGLKICGSDPDTDSLRIYNTFSDRSSSDWAWGIDMFITNSATFPFSLEDMSLTIDMSMVKQYEYFAGFFMGRSAGGIQVRQMVNDNAIVGIDIVMDNAVITISGSGDEMNLAYGMWANPNYSSITAKFINCTFNITDFLTRGLYTGRDLAYSSSATYNNCNFNIHSAVSSGIGVHVSSDTDYGFGTSTLTLNYPDGEVEAETAAVYARGANPSMVINGATMEAWQKDGTEIADPQIVSIFLDLTMTDYIAKTVGITDAVYTSADYEKKAARIIFTRLPYPQTGDSSMPVLYGLGLLLAAAGLVLVGKLALRNR